MPGIPTNICARITQVSNEMCMLCHLGLLCPLGEECPYAHSKLECDISLRHDCYNARLGEYQDYTNECFQRMVSEEESARVQSHTNAENKNAQPSTDIIPSEGENEGMHIAL